MSLDWLDHLRDRLDAVSFAAPLALAALLLIPVALVAYGWVEWRRRGTASRFASLALLPNLLPRRPSWRRHVGPAVLLLALAALVCGAARPQREATVPRRQATVVLVIDTSRSMSATDVKPTRLAAAQAAARTLVAELPPEGRIGVVAFTRTPQALNAPTDDRVVVDGSLRSLHVGGGTAVGDALVKALALVHATPGATTKSGRAASAIVLLSDGASTEGHVGPLAAARRAKAQHVPVYTISLGKSSATIRDPGSGRTIAVPPDPASLARVARAAGGKTYSAHDAAKLKSVYGQIGRTVGTQRTEQDLTRIFIAGGGLLVLVSLLFSLRWFRGLV